MRWVKGKIVVVELCKVTTQGGYVHLEKVLQSIDRFDHQVATQINNIDAFYAKRVFRVSAQLVSIISSNLDDHPNQTESLFTRGFPHRVELDKLVLYMMNDLILDSYLTPCSCIPIVLLFQLFFLI